MLKKHLAEKKSNGKENENELLEDQKHIFKMRCNFFKTLFVNILIISLVMH